MNIPRCHYESHHVRHKGSGKCRSTNKTIFANENLAKSAMHSQQDQGVPVCRVYRCSKCNGWHLTSSKRRAKAIRADADGRISGNRVHTPYKRIRNTNWLFEDFE